WRRRLQGMATQLCGGLGAKPPAIRVGWAGILNERESNPPPPGQQADQPETLRDVGLGPTQHLEMMMERRHAKQTSSVGNAEVRDLENDGERLRHETEADDREQEQLTCHQSDDCQGCPE